MSSTTLATSTNSWKTQKRNAQIDSTSPKRTVRNLVTRLSRNLNLSAEGENLLGSVDRARSRNHQQRSVDPLHRPVSVVVALVSQLSLQALVSPLVDLVSPQHQRSESLHSASGSPRSANLPSPFLGSQRKQFRYLGSQQCKLRYSGSRLRQPLSLGNQRNRPRSLDSLRLSHRLSEGRPLAHLALANLRHWALRVLLLLLLRPLDLASLRLVNLLSRPRLSANPHSRRLASVKHLNLQLASVNLPKQAPSDSHRSRPLSCSPPQRPLALDRPLPPQLQTWRQRFLSVIVQPLHLHLVSRPPSRACPSGLNHKTQQPKLTILWLLPHPALLEDQPRPLIRLECLVQRLVPGLATLLHLARLQSQASLFFPRTSIRPQHHIRSQTRLLDRSTTHRPFLLRHLQS